MHSWSLLGGVERKCVFAQVIHYEPINLFTLNSTDLQN